MPYRCGRTQTDFGGAGLAGDRDPEHTAGVRVLLPAVAAALSLAAAAHAEDPDTIVTRLHSEGAECHYVLSICSDTVRAEGALARLRSANVDGDAAARNEGIAAAEARVAKQGDLLTRAAAAVRRKHSSVPGCFRHCERLKDYR